MKDDKVGARFDWKLVFAVTPLGLAFAALTITGALKGVKATQGTALALLVVTAAIVALRASGRPFGHGFAAGFLAALVAIETQALFLPLYFANNPQWADLEMPFGWSPRLATAVLGPLNAVLAGLLAGALAWGFAAARGSRSGPGAEGRQHRGS